jgi:formylglycine-generating enzyme required for sulfatase activity
MGVREDSDCVYRYVNVHNPRCPLVFDRREGRWSVRAGMEAHPLYGVNWAGAKLMCAHLGGRLPLAREWECFASNNDASRKYPWGDARPTHLLANFGEHFGGASRVGSFPPSDLGLYDLAGNVGEWCLDAYDADEEGGDSEPSPPAVERVVKGGAWSKDAEHLEIARSRGKWERLGTTTIGFRTVWDE